MSKETNTNIKEVDSAALAVASHEAAIDAEDIDIPRLNVIQKMSSSEFDHGSLVLDKHHEIVQAETKIPCIVLGAIKKWKEDIPFDTDEMPIIVDTKEAMLELKNNSEYDILEFAEIIMMFPQPEDNEDSEAFPYPIGDTNYCIGKIYVQKDAYRKTYKSLMTFAAFNRSLSVSSRYWTFEAQVFSKGKYSWFVPTLSVTKDEVPLEIAEFVNNFSL